MSFDCQSRTGTGVPFTPSLIVFPRLNCLHSNLCFIFVLGWYWLGFFKAL